MKNLSFAMCLGLAAVLAGCSSDSNSDVADTVGSTTDTPVDANDNTNGNTTVDNTQTDSGTTVDNTDDGVNDNTSGELGENSGDDTTPENNTTVITTPEDNTTVDNSENTTQEPATDVSLLGAGLSHTGTPVDSVAAIANDPLILSSGQARVRSLANSPAVIFEVVNNAGTSVGLDCNALGGQFNSCNIVNLHIKDSNGDLNDSDWKLYFHSTRRMLQITSDEFDLTHVNGDLHYLSPNDQFNGFAGDVKSIKLITEFNYLIESDFQPRYWIARGGNAQLITNTDDDTNESAYAMDITGGNRLEFSTEPNEIASSSNRFARNAELNTSTSSIAAINVASRIVPKPNSVVTGNGFLNIGSGFSFANLALPAASVSALQTRQAQFMSTAAGVTLQSAIDSAMPASTYTLSVSAGGIEINASDESMLFYAAQSLLALVDPGVSTIPYVEVIDSPRFDFRGMHVDVARNFHSVDSIKGLIDQMAAYKLNKLHLHLSDDEGWRLEIPSLPELTSVGGTREFNVDTNGLVTETNALMPAMGSGPNSNNQGSGFFSQAQFIDLLQYAANRYIVVIPELDMPAHARAAVVAMRARAANLGDANNTAIRIDDPADTSNYLTVQNYNDSFINPCVPGTTTFIQSVVRDVKSMYTAAGLPLDTWHMGGDEAVNILLGGGYQGSIVGDQPWAKSSACTALINSNPSVSSIEDLTPYFVNLVAQAVADEGISALYAYHEIYDTTNPDTLATASAGINHWLPLSSNNEATASATIGSANDFNTRGFETIIAAPDFLYFDFTYEVDPKERGYYWASRQTDTRKVFSFAPENLAQNAETSLARSGDTWSATNQGSYTGYKGMQGYLWSETVRTPQQFDYMIFPRLLALAERAWHKALWEIDYVEGESFGANSGKVNTQALDSDYATFSLALAEKEFSKLDAAGVQYRIPPPGASVQGGQLQMNTNFPGLPLEYSADANSWQTWSATNPPASAGFVRSRSADNSRIGRATPVE